MSRAIMGYVEIIEAGERETFWVVLERFLKKIWQFQENNRSLLYNKTLGLFGQTPTFYQSSIQNKTSHQQVTKLITIKMARSQKKAGNVYETVQANIQKITRPSGTVSYRVRVSQDGEMYSEYATSLRAARSIRKSLVA